jgi:DNA-binding GntR family transcriptional regulator
MTELRKVKNKENGLAIQLKNDIISGKYRAGEWLKQTDLENIYQANRFETRMALSDLAARKIISHIPNRGYRVINPSDKEREDLYEVRTLLETAASKLAVQKAQTEDIDELQTIVDQFEDAIEHQSKEVLMDLNMQFHNKFYAISGNKLLCQQIEEMRYRGLPGRQGGWDTVTGLRASNQDHAEMIEKIRRRDIDGVSYTVYRHLNRWREFSTPNSNNN